MTAWRDYAVVTSAYWGLTLTDGALRMIVLLHFHSLGYTPIELAALFVLYEFFGVVTNLVGGWIAARLGLRFTLYAGLWLQIAALFMLSQLDPSWSREMSVLYVFLSQGLSGVAKDLTKMSAKSSIKILLPEGGTSRLFKWVAALTGSKNALKGAGFFLGGALLTSIGFEGALIFMAAGLAVVLVASFLLLKQFAGQPTSKPPFSRILSKTRDINLISLARFFLFGGRDVWFVVGVPLFLDEVLGWSFVEIGTFMAVWVIVYGFVQAVAPRFVQKSPDGVTMEVIAASLWGGALAIVPLLLAVVIYLLTDQIALTDNIAWLGIVTVGELALFGILFAINSSLHSYLILAISDTDQTTLNVGFYYMANAGGRFLGTLMSGMLYQIGGVEVCLIGSAVLIAAAAILVRGIGRQETVTNVS
ncbi:organoarsenical effux MFS transporter ArsJ [Sneathiella sp. HT1-7]|uniref:organoarsenical effux MFS transporter ArsJ n=1 Tax=Sneathiella sp. HT1-7 TaxID=2887192 RepID=UPI001D141004|nr:organoarsenical effux MFS transporter ArsJ [Sneathiella sp. HT1-7]MCC3303235.1 organoarsenical effux MFS transporter ArsJ [Sneathiella sp. HT1-7]